MNNRYLYRAKRCDTGEWITGIGISERKHGVTLVWKSEDGCLYETYVDPSTICQCTGLKDKNGKLIFENDIVDGHIKRGAAFYQCIVLWNECKARFDVRAMELNFPMTLDECTDDISICGLDYEVIGNIFDNPELLEVGK